VREDLERTARKIRMGRPFLFATVSSAAGSFYKHSLVSKLRKGCDPRTGSESCEKNSLFLRCVENQAIVKMATPACRCPPDCPSDCPSDVPRQQFPGLTAAASRAAACHPRRKGMPRRLKWAVWDLQKFSFAKYTVFSPQ